MAKSELPILDLGMDHVTNIFCAYFASYGSNVNNFEVKIPSDAVSYLTQLDEMTPYQFTQVFKAAPKQDPDTLSYDEAMADLEHLKEWLAAAAKEIKQLEAKGCWVECLRSEAEQNGQKVIPCTWVF